MNKTFNLLLFIKKNKIRSNGTAPIYLRITVDGKAAEISAKRYIDPKNGMLKYTRRWVIPHFGL